jgi:hypothetical protein
MPPNTPSDDKVGFGKPPRHSRFKKGQSGNITGRPRGSKNFATLLNQALNQTITVVENGRRRKITKREAVISQLVNKSAGADLRAIKILFDIQQALEARSEPGATEAGSPADLAQSDRAIIDRYLKKFSRGDTNGK